MFANRQVLTNVLSATITGSNTNATIEPGEPLHANKIGGHSLWIAWTAPADGLVTLNTAGSTFDTLLATYILDPGRPVLSRLENIAANDDSGGQETSFLQFGANAGQTYQIAVDGFNGATGDVLLQLSFLASSNLQPTIIGVPADQSLRLGDPLILTINFLPSPNLQFRWFLNGSPVAGQDDDSISPTLVIPSLQATNLGFYALKFYLNDDSFFSSSIEIQVNSEGLPKVLAHNKIADAALSGLSGGVVLGYNGTQIFNTTNAIVDPNAPQICSVPPGAAYWFSYQAPSSGLMSIDTTNSAFPTLLAVFTYNGPLVSYTNLILVACDNNNGGTGTNFSAVQFPVVAGTNYFIVVGGVNGARGVAHLNYQLTAGVPPIPPALSAQPQSMIVATQTAVMMSVVPTGTGPFFYQWRKNNNVIRQQTNATLLFRSPQSSDGASYSVVVTNYSGAVTSAPALLNVMSTPVIQYDPVSQSLISGFPAIRGFQYSVDYCTNPVWLGWFHWTNAFPDYGGVIWLTNYPASSGFQLQNVHTP